MKEIHSEIGIEAGAEVVWEVLADFDAYPEWNPFIPDISGDKRVGARLRVRLQPPGGRGATFRPRLLVFEPGHEIRWLGSLLVPGLFDGEHILAIEPLEGDKVRFSQREKFTGLLVPLLSKTLTSASRGFEAMNKALKERAESFGDLDPPGHRRA